MDRKGPQKVEKFLRNSDIFSKFLKQLGKMKQLQIATLGLKQVFRSEICAIYKRMFPQNDPHNAKLEIFISKKFFFTF